MKKARVLIVEDEGLSALAIKTFLEECGYVVSGVVSTGDEAVTAAIQTEPDVVLMDIRLGGGDDGIVAAERIGKSFRIPVIYLTAYSDEETLRRASRTEPFGYVVKPLDERAVCAAIETAVYKASIEREMRMTKEKQGTILRSIGDGIVVANAHGAVDYVNAAARRLLGLPDDGKPIAAPILSLFQLFDAASGAQAVLPLQRVMIDGESASLTECALVSAGGPRLVIDLDLAPLRDDRGSPQGVIVAFRDVSDRRRGDDEVSLELVGAIDLQRRLAPESGARAGDLELRCFLRTAALGAGNQFDFFPIDRGRAAFYFLDVFGRGVPALGLSILLRGLLSRGGGRGQSLLSLGADPGEPRAVLERLNEAFFAEAQRVFFSLCYGVVELETGIAKLARAGGPAPVVQAPDGALRELSDAPEQAFALRRGERLFLYSEGIAECADQFSKRFGKDRLLSLIESSRSKSLADAVSRIERGVIQWRGWQSFDDDLALLAVERGPGS